MKIHADVNKDLNIPSVFSSRLVLISIVAATSALTGCQPALDRNSLTNPIQNKPLIASQEYRRNMHELHASYQRQFDNGSAIDTDAKAKTTLLKTISNQLNTPHVSVTQTRIHEVPFISEDSIDQGADSIYKTVLILAGDYIGGKKSSSEEEWDNSEEEWDSSEEEWDSSEEEWDYSDGEWDYSIEEVYEDEAYYENEVYEDETYYEDESFLENEADNDQAYYVEDSPFKDNNIFDSESNFLGSNSDYQQLIDTIYNWFHRTPAQIEANNFYVNKNMNLSQITEFDPDNKTISTVYSYDFLAPTTTLSLQIPVAVNFNESQLTLDPSALLPLVALSVPDDAPLPEELEASTVAFKLPYQISEKVPPSVIYDAFIKAINQGLYELDSSNFTALDITNDTYAKSLGAKSAVKLNLSSKQTGQLLGFIVKQLSNSLKEYVELRPDLYPDQDKFRILVDKWQQSNSKYQTKDMGSILQLIEAVAPISFDNTNYYYLDSQGKLLGKQTQTTLGSDFMGSNSTLLSQTNYKQGGFTSHPYHSLFEQSFGKPFSSESPKSMDGNAWLENINKRKHRKDLASEVRQYYRYENDYDYSEQDSINGDNPVEDYSPSVSLIDYGSVNDDSNTNKNNDYNREGSQ